ncbi:hypothetical protein [Rhizobium leguminosarum]|uniref:hypothetical protein n=1 Tax=Rhizobium leguminosarum TaxID=384 RepID=UPI001AE507FA|nr:hypothetical protein [Rhizobium leguminosarum]MBP2442830.1 hypothetical protein [Rhizobium leguminosarum]
MSSIVANRHFNNPELGAAFSNLASMFGPVSGSDLAGYATAKAKKEEANRMAEFFNYAHDPNYNREMADRLNYAINGNANNTFYNVDQGNATTRRGQDVAAQTSVSNNKADNAERFAATRYGPLNANQTLPDLPTSVASMYGVPGSSDQHGAVVLNPGETATLPGGQFYSGQAKPLSETEWQAQQNERLLQSGQLSDQMLLDAITGKEAPVMAVSPTGPKYMTPGAATRTGAEPYIKPDAGAKPETQNYKTPDGKVGTAVFDPVKKNWFDTVSGQPLPQGSMTFNSALQGDAASTGLGKSTEAQDRNAYAAEMAAPATDDLLTAFDTGKLPTGSDYQANALLAQLPANFRPAIVAQMTPEGQRFYQNMRTALPYQLMSQSGQAVTEQEYDRKLLELMPVPGEDKSVTAAKRRQFETYIRTAKAVAGPGYAKVEEALGRHAAGSNGGQTNPGAATVATGTGAASAAVDPLAAAKAAIAKGASREAVIKRLVDNGIDPKGL